MHRSTLSLSAAALALALAACTPQPPASAGDPAADAMPPATGAVDDALQPAAPGMDSCDAGAVQSLAGQQATDEVIEQARMDAGAEIVRTLRPGQVVTMEFRAGRLNIDVDDDGTITGLRCG
jgi:hypothetical protein